LAAILMMNVDKIFVNQYLSLNEVGIFGVCALFATLIKVPYNSIAKISTGIIAESWKRNDIVHIQEIYRKSAINQAIAGTLIFVGILVNLHNIFEILPPVYSSGKWVLVVYSAGMLWVTIIGMAGIITETSRYFRVTTLFLLLSVLLQFFLNYMLIPKFGITGAAVATITAFIVNYSFQLVFQWVKFGIKGLSKEVFIVMFSGLVIILLSGILPRLSLLPDIALRSGIVTFVFCSVIYFLKVSPEINDLVNSYLNKLGLNGRK
jgi:O-antigen/teichoic acid export membrane protein